MKRVTIFITGVFLLFTFPLFYRTTQKIAGNNKYGHFTRKVEDFNKIKINHAVNVIYHQNADSAGYILLYCEDNLPAHIKTQSEKGKLHIKLSGLKSKDFGIIILHVYSSFLTEVENGSSGTFETVGKLFGAEVKFGMIGNGQIKAENLHYNIVKAKIMTGSGDILLAGVCDYADLSVIGSGEIRAHDLQAKQVKCTITGNGNIGCYALSKLTTLSTGSGNVFYNGQPEIKKRSIGTGKVIPIGGTEIISPAKK